MSSNRADDDAKTLALNRGCALHTHTSLDKCKPDHIELEHVHTHLTYPCNNHPYTSTPTHPNAITRIGIPEIS